jgi:putative acetyltransferase
VQICQAISPGQIAHVRPLFEEYARWLGIDLGFQGFAQELAGLPGLYAPPRGRLLLASVGEQTVACAALRPLPDSTCEMKRLYVLPAFRTLGIGKNLAQRIIDEGRSIGYSRMRLDTLPWMSAAIHLYETLGFVRCGAYYDTPLADTVFMELRL